MVSSLSRRRALQASGVALAGGTAGCLGGDQSSETIDYSALSTVDMAATPQLRDTPGETPKPDFRIYKAAKPTDTLLILLHNATLDSRSLQPLAQAIADAGAAQVVTPDIRGHGPNPLRRGDVDYKYQPGEDLVRLIRIRKFLRNLIDARPFRTIIVGGHGAGGGVVTRLGWGAQAPQADGYLLLAPHLGRDVSTTKPGFGGWQQYDLLMLVVANLFSQFDIDYYADSEVVTLQMPTEARYGDETLSYTYRMAVSLLPPEEDSITEIDYPTLTVVGSDDEVLNAPAFRPLLSDDDSSDLRILDGLNHLDLMADPAVYEPVVQWIEKISS
jgi:pimeloyl-ACP methyl ester carboxylesterase